MRIPPNPPPAPPPQPPLRFDPVDTPAAALLMPGMDVSLAFAAMPDQAATVVVTYGDQTLSYDIDPTHGKLSGQVNGQSFALTNQAGSWNGQTPGGHENVHVAAGPAGWHATGKVGSVDTDESFHLTPIGAQVYGRVGGEPIHMAYRHHEDSPYTIGLGAIGPYTWSQTIEVHGDGTTTVENVFGNQTVHEVITPHRA